MYTIFSLATDPAVLHNKLIYPDVSRRWQIDTADSIKT